MYQKKITKTHRQLTIYTKFQLRSYSKNVKIPEIRIAGKWLRESGFEEGKRINIKVAQNKLIITLEEES